MNTGAGLGFQVTDSEFQQFRKLLYEESGIALSKEKKTLLISRLSKRLRRLELNSFQEYYDFVQGDQGSEEFIQMLDLLSTNKTDFFREPKHFKFLEDQVLPGRRQEKTLAIWSAAASSGEEPYSIAMTLCDGVRSPSQWKFKILASDLSTRMLAQASSGIYKKDRVRNLSKPLLKRHFLEGKRGSEGKVKVKSHLSDMISYRRINLMDERFPIKTPLDVIFCRNVMIYFDHPTMAGLITKFHRYLKPGGYLFIGHSESLHWMDHPFEAVAPTIYRKREDVPDRR